MSGKRRPLASKSIIELEALFEAGAERTTLALLAQELDHRSTDRARKLRIRVLAASPPRSPTPINAPTQARARATAPKARPVKAAPEPTPADPGQPPPERPRGADEPRSILSAWTALEALSPQTYRRPEDRANGDPSCVAWLHGDLPWTKNERSRPDKQLYYQIILGAVRVDGAMQRLIRAFGADEERSDRAREKAVLAAVLVDRQGCLLAENAIALSSFGRALPLALELKLGELGDWPAVERRATGRLDDMLRRVDADGRPVPLDAAVIDRAFQWIVDEFRLPGDLAEPPSFAVRIYHYYKSPDPPEPDLLNSFFLHDLARAQALGTRLPAALRRYLGAEQPGRTFDLQRQQAALEIAVKPKLTPSARWPSPGGHPLVLLQQAAVNLARHEPASGGLLAVNGPPGTGKTTLLRDIVAGAVVDRAVAMAALADPNDAFTASGQKVSAGPNAFWHLYTLAPAVRGHEVLVASSNNKAVENISRELPAVAAIGRSADPLSYFRSVSDHLHAVGGVADADGGEPARVETWGLIAAVLGNARNRFTFSQRFWWDKDRSFRLYLKAAKGDSVVREVKDEQGRVVRRETPSVVTAERPPAPGSAMNAWRSARKRFIDLHGQITAELAALEQVRQTCLNLATARQALREAQAKLPPLHAAHAAARAREVAARGPRDEAAARRDRDDATLVGYRRTRPALFVRLFRRASWRSWTLRLADLTADAERSRAAWAAAERPHADAAKQLDTAAAALRAAQGEQDASAFEAARLAGIVEAHRPRLADRIVDEAFFARGHEASNLAAPWVPDDLHARREELFAAALALHRAFIDASAQKMLHNLSALMDVLAKGPPKDAAKRALLGDLWSTLFLAVPVLSTTFASVDAMFGELGTDAFGWLLIDEAGQALPQAAVGALMRARRAVVVGDPLQVPPVVSLPDRLTAEICRWFKVDVAGWGAPAASAQTVTDRASRFRGGFEGDAGRREVGVPLLVHRRCQEPMFGIANAIAYDGQMVFAAGRPVPGQAGALLGPSAWFDVDGDATGKWCPAEGECVLRMLRALANGGVYRPDLFIVTPFRIVAQELRRRLEQEAGLLPALGLDSRAWLRDRVGTVHTVQGREADTVLLVLGAPAASQGGARSWAAGTPNILNVAVSRARQNLYVIGSRGAWAGVGHAAELGRLPRVAGAAWPAGRVPA